jgi:hypothetical protein
MIGHTVHLNAFAYLSEHVQTVSEAHQPPIQQTMGNLPPGVKLSIIIAQQAFGNTVI